jgi:hypothetical protein
MCRKLELLVPPLDCAVVAGDQSGSTQTAKIP